MFLSDASLLDRMAIGTTDAWRRLVVEPFDDRMLQGCSIDVHLGPELKIFEGPRTDTRRDNSPWWRVQQEEVDLVFGTARPIWVLQPDRFYLAMLAEYIQIPEDCCGQLSGVSTRARDGVEIHQQAGLLDPGWFGWATLEIKVANAHTIIFPGQRIGQVTLTLLDQRTTRPYRGRYQGNSKPQPAIVGGETTYVG